MSLIHDLNTLLQCISQEQNNTIRANAEKSLENFIVPSSKVHQEILGFVQNSNELIKSKLLLIFVKQSLNKLNPDDFESEIELNEILKMYLNVYFCQDFPTNMKEILIKIILKLIELSENSQLSIRFVNSFVWTQVASFSLKNLKNGLLFLKMIHKKYHSVIFLEPNDLLNNLSDLCCQVFKEAQNCSQNNSNFGFDDFLLIAKYLIENLFVLSQYMNRMNDDKQTVLFENLLLLMKSNFVDVASSSELNQLFLSEDSDTLLAKSIKIKTKILKLFSTVRDQKSQSHKTILVDLLIYSEAKLRETVSLQVVSLDLASPLFKSFVYHLLDLLNRYIPDPELFLFYKERETSISEIILQLLNPTYQCEIESIPEYLDMVDDSVEGGNFQTIQSASLSIFRNFCDYNEFYIQKSIEEIHQNIIKIVEKQNFEEKVLRNANGQFLMIASISFVKKIRSDLLETILQISKLGLQHFASFELVFPSVLLVPKNFLAEFVNCFDSVKVTNEFVAPLINFCFSAIQENNGRVKFHSGIRFLEFVFSNEILTESPRFAERIRSNSDNLFLLFIESYCALDFDHIAALVRTFVQNFGELLNSQLILKALELFSNTKILENSKKTIEILYTFKILLTARHFSNHEIETFDFATTTFLRAIFSKNLYEAIEDNISSFFAETISHQKFVSDNIIVILPEILSKLEKNYSSVESYFLALNGFLVFGHEKISIEIHSRICSLLIKNNQNTFSVYLLISVLQNLGKYTSLELSNLIIQIASLALSDFIPDSDFDHFRSVIMLVFNFVLFVPETFHSAFAVEIVFNYMSRYAIHNNSILTSYWQKKIMINALIFVLQNETHRIFYQNLINRSVLVLFDNIKVIQSTEIQNPSKSKKKKKKENDSEDESSDEEFHLIQDRRPLLYSKFIHTTNIPDEIQTFKKFCLFLKQSSPNEFDQRLLMFPPQVKQFIQESFSMESVIIDREKNVVQNRKIVRLKKN